MPELLKPCIYTLAISENLMNYTIHQYVFTYFRIFDALRRQQIMLSTRDELELNGNKSSESRSIKTMTKVICVSSIFKTGN